MLNLSRSAKRVKEAIFDHGFGILPSEINTAQNLRRSIFFKRNLEKGHIIEIEDLEVKSPGIGIHPKFVDIIVGRKIKKNVEADYPISWDDII